MSVDKHPFCYFLPYETYTDRFIKTAAASFVYHIMVGKMRSGGCSLHHKLTAEAASVVQQAVWLARRRGHAQVTPIHVALTLLISESFGLLRKACRQANYQAFQCRTLEFCFNVALNRLPTTSNNNSISSDQGPSISNALVAVFKRAQANQRRCCFDPVQHHHGHGHQAGVGLKVEVEQLVISILDDPSVSRVMREAGLSSSLLKQSVETSIHSHEVVANRSCLQKSDVRSSSDEADVLAVVESLLGWKKSRNTVVVGECLSTAENVVKEVMKRLNTSKMPDELRKVELINPQLCVSWFSDLDRSNLTERLLDLDKAITRSALEGRGAIVYLGDLKWALESHTKDDCSNTSCQCPLKFVIMELGRMVTCHAKKNRIWALGIATYQTYNTLRTSEMEMAWGFHPVNVPTGSLTLSLSLDNNSSYNNWEINSPLDTSNVEAMSSPISTLWKARSIESMQKLEFEERGYGFLEDVDICTKRARPNRCSCSQYQWDPNPLHNKHSQMNPFFTHEDTGFLSPKPPDIFSPIPRMRSTTWDMFEDIGLCNASRFDNLEPTKENHEDVMFKTLSRELEERIGENLGIAPRIVSTVLMVRAKELSPSTCFLFLGSDYSTKNKMIKALADVFFGSENKVKKITPSKYLCLRGHQDELLRVMRSNRNCVLVLENIDDCDYEDITSILEGLHAKKMGDAYNIEDVCMGVSIVVMISSKPRDDEHFARKTMKSTCVEGRWKRKAEWDEPDDSANTIIENNLDLNLSTKFHCKSLVELAHMTLVFDL